FRSPVHRGRPGHSAERAAHHGRYGRGAVRSGVEARDVSASARQRARQTENRSRAGACHRRHHAQGRGTSLRAWTAAGAVFRHGAAASHHAGRERRGIDSRLGGRNCERRAREPSVIKLSVNVNKVATVRNSRGGSIPSVIEAVRTCIDAGAPGITVHPRADERHITTADVHEIADELAPLKGRVEFNIEGDPRPGFLDLVLAVKPDQCTLVPVKPGEITSEAGWPADTPADTLAGIVGALKASGVRVSLFVDPEPAAIRWARAMGADRVELYTEPFARAFERGPAAASASFANYAAASNLAFDLGVGVNAGHDLDLKNLTLFKTLPHLDEVSIGHALISRAMFVGLGRVVKEYLAALSLVLLSILLASPAAAAGTRVSIQSA